MKNHALSKHPATPINQANIIPFHQNPTWQQQAKRLHDDGHEEFSRVCSNVRMTAQFAAFPRDDSFFALIDNMERLKKSPFWLNVAVEKIEEIYNEAYSISERVDPSQLADVVPFPMSVQGGV
ncbi:hypothetical protein [Desulfobacter curvatus]|uniref:hypothetical protein n=1 Tax=Desulfobacter curvatus TaxID=2290 RepID=UPI0003713633|nr:hypothetical protein [Desulfobacter curvatus]